MHRDRRFARTALLVALATAGVAARPATAQDAPSEPGVAAQDAQYRSALALQKDARWHDLLELVDHALGKTPRHRAARALRYQATMAAVGIGDYRVVLAQAEAWERADEGVVPLSEIHGAYVAAERTRALAFTGRVAEARARVASGHAGIPATAGMAGLGLVEIDPARVRGVVVLPDPGPGETDGGRTGVALAALAARIDAAAARAREMLGAPDLPAPRLLLRSGVRGIPEVAASTAIGLLGDVLTPVVTVEPSALDQPVDVQERVLAHEIVHVWGRNLAPWRFRPRWLEEGIATWAEGDAARYLRGALPPFVSLVGARLESLAVAPLDAGRTTVEEDASDLPGAFHVLGTLLLHRLEGEHGPGFVRRIAARCLRGGDTRAILAEASGWTVETAEARLSAVLDAAVAPCVTYRSAMAEYRAGKWAAAQSHYERLLAEHPRSPLAAQSSMELGVCLVQRYRYRDARPVLEGFLRDHSDHPDAAWARFYLVAAMELTGPRGRIVQLCDEILARPGRLAEPDIERVRQIRRAAESASAR